MRWVRLVRTSARIVRVSGVSEPYSGVSGYLSVQRLFFSVRSINTPLTPSVTLSLSLAHFEPDQVLTLEQALSLPPL